MLKPFFLVFLTLFVFVQAHRPIRRANKSPSVWDPAKKTYPAVQRESVVFQYPSAKANGKVSVADPYNWLEKPTNESEVQSFIKKQSDLADSFLSQCKDKDAITQSIRQANSYVFYSHFIEVGLPENPSYVFAAQGNDLVMRWYYASPNDIANAKKSNFAQIPGKVLVDESTLSNDGSLYVDVWQVSNDKKLAAYTVVGGDAGVELRLIDLTTFKHLPETIPYGGRMSFTFSPDNKGLIYDHQAYQLYNDPDPFNRQSKILYHKFGSDPKSDIIIVKADTQEITNLWYVEYTADEKYLMLYGLTDEDHYRVYVAPLDGQTISEDMKWISLQPEYGPAFQYVTNSGTDFVFVTKRDGAQNHEMVRGKIDPSKAKAVKNLSELSETIKTQDLIAENKAGNLESWSLIDKSKIVLIYLEYAKYNFYVNNLVTGKRIQQLFSEFIGKFYRAAYNYNAKQSFVEVSSFNIASGIYRFHSDKGKVSIEPFLIGKPTGIDLSEFKAEQHFATSKDGTKVPFDIFYSRKHPLNASTTAWLFGYGSFGQNTIPYYDAFMVPWIRERGGASVYLQIRGGGELGDKWHEAGMLNQRQHSFDDYQAVAQYLVKKKMAAEGKIIAEGGEAGGTVAMVMGNQAYQGLFGAILPGDALLDMLRFDKYPYPDQYIAEWGSPQDPKGFDVLRAYSPLHNVDNKKTYPATLITQSLTYQSSTPAHSFKMIAELQHSLPKNANPLLMWTSEIDDPTKYIETSNIIKQCFVNQVLGLKKV